METTSWTLRLALLLIGLLVVTAIYLLSQWRRRRETNRRQHRLRDGWPRRRGEFEMEEEDEFQLGSSGAEEPIMEDDFEIIVVKPREKPPIEDLPAVTHEVTHSVEPVLAAPPIREASAPEALPPVPESPPQPKTTRRRRDNQLSLSFGDDELSAGPSPVSAPLPPPEVLALYLRPPHDGRFHGPLLETAFAAVGLRFGDMNIYHHFGAGSLRTEQPLFSLANMFEPGQFNPDEMADFSTDGLALFIQFPTALDGQVAFEMFLTVAQRLAEELKADLLSEPRKALDSHTIERMRRIASRYVLRR
jgi:cell division protein ZipA